MYHPPQNEGPGESPASPDRSLQRTFRAYGTSFGLRSNDRTTLEQAVARARSLGWTPVAADRVDVDYILRLIGADRTVLVQASWQLQCDETVVRSTSDLPALIDAFEDHAKNLTAYRAEGCLFVHAGAVSWWGRGIVIPGRSRAGKTTLVKALVEAGAQYYSDEFAVLDREGRVHPYTLPLSIRANGRQAATRIPAEAFGARAGALPVPVRLIAVTEYRRYARWRPQPLSHGQALLALMENAVAARRAPDHTMPVLRQCALIARAIKSPRGEARSAAAAILSELA